MTSVYGSSGAASSLALFYQQLAKKGDASSTSAAKTSSKTTAGVDEIAGAQPASGPPDLAALFQTLDTDGNGTVSKEEFSTAFSKLDDQTKSALLNAQGTQSTVDDLYSDIDADGSGGISESEFAAAAPQVSAQAAPAHHHHHHGGGGMLASSDDTTDTSSIFGSLDPNADPNASEDGMTAALDDMLNIAQPGDSQSSSASQISTSNNATLNQTVANLYSIFNSGSNTASTSQSSAIFA